MSIGLMICGGTFDSQQDASGGSREVEKEFDPARYQALISAGFQKLPGLQVELIAPPERIDSSQLTPAWLGLLVSKIRVYLERVRHVGDPKLVVAIGTDTLSYVVPAVATALGSVPECCIIFVSGMNPWYAENSDAMQNFVDALSIASKGHHRGVMMVSGRRVYGPSNIAKVSHDALDPFRQIQLAPRGAWQDLPLVIQERLGRGESIGKPYSGSQVAFFRPPVEIQPLTEDSEIQSRVIQIHVFPGLEVDAVLHFVGDKQHVIFRCYANGTAPVSLASREFDLSAAVRELSMRGVKCYAVSQHLGAIAPGDYGVCKEMEEAGCLYVTRFTAETLHAVLLVMSASLDAAQVYEKIRDAELQAVA